MIRALRAMLVDDSGAALAEYGIIAVGLAVPLMAVGAAIASTAGVTLAGTTAGMQTIGANPP